jgi:hypothetical protein
MTIKIPEQIRKVERVEMPTLTLLQRAIYEAAAPIFHAPDVKEYQERARKKLARQYWMKHYSQRPAVMLAVAMVCGAGSVAFLGLWPSIPAMVLAVAFGFLAVAAIVAGACEATAVSSHNLARWEWLPYSLYPNCAPLEIQRRAEKIRKHCPAAMLNVEYLAEDPFLKVEHGDEAYYVGVWDETGFVG